MFHFLRSILALTHFTGNAGMQGAPLSESSWYQALFQLAPVPYFVHDLDGVVLDGNEAMEELSGWKKEEAVGKTFFELGRLSPEAIEKAKARMARLARGECPGPTEFTFTRRDGRQAILEVNSMPLQTPQGTVVLVVARDVTRQRQYEARYRRREALREAIARSARRLLAGDGKAIHDVLAEVGNAVRVHRAYLWRIRENGTRLDMTHEWCAPGVEPAIERMQNLEAARFSWFMERARQGEVVAIPELNALPPEASAERALLQPLGGGARIVAPIQVGEELVGLVGFVDALRRDWDAEEIRSVRLLADMLGVYLQREDALRGMMETLRRYLQMLRLVEAMPQLIALMTPDYRVVHLNPSGRRLLGLGEQESVTDLSLFDMHPASVHGLLREEAIPQALRAGIWTGDVPLIARTGEEIPGRQMLIALKTAGGEMDLLASVVRDLRERLVLEEELRQAQKMEAVGRLAGGVVHDCNNLLTPILTYSQLALHRLEPENPLRRHLEIIASAGERMSRLMGQLLAFSRRQPLEPQVLNPNTLIEELTKMLVRLVGEDIAMQTILDPLVGNVFADPGQIEQVLINLVVNARDAMPNGGQLLIETSNVSLTPEYCRLHPTLRPGPYVLIAVTDTGCGMDRETMSHIFEPFFTTKERGKGTGLGLSVVHGIVSQSGGAIHVYSELGKGTTFKIYLPRVEAVPAERARREEFAVPTGTETILVVEDEDPVRASVVDSLRMFGYTVLEANSGESALKIAGEHAGPIHLLLTDVVMPQMNGRQVAEALRAQRPDVKVLYMSGYTENVIVHHGILDPNVAFVQKPVMPSALARKVREVLEGHA